MEKETLVTKHKAVVAFVGIALVAFVAYVISQRNTDLVSDSVEQEVFCTKEAKVCPDGTTVGRVPPSCDFAPCPSE